MHSPYSIFDDEEVPEFEDHSHEGTSPVEVLRLTECCAEEAPLAAVLSWPQKPRGASL